MVFWRGWLAWGGERASRRAACAAPGRPLYQHGARRCCKYQNMKFETKFVFENEQKYFKTNIIWLFSNMTTAFKRLFFYYLYDFQGVFSCLLSRLSCGWRRLGGKSEGVAGSRLVKTHATGARLASCESARATERPRFDSYQTRMKHSEHKIFVNQQSVHPFAWEPTTSAANKRIAGTGPKPAFSPPSLRDGRVS